METPAHPFNIPVKYQNVEQHLYMLLGKLSFRYLALGEKGEYFLGTRVGDTSRDWVQRKHRGTAVTIFIFGQCLKIARLAIRNAK